VIWRKIYEKYSFNDKFDENKEKREAILSELKVYAENAKIELSSVEKTVIDIDGLTETDDNGQEIELMFEFSRSEFNELIRAYVDETIAISKKVISDSGIDSCDISKVILVGGPTQIPYIRERIKNDLELEVDTTVDPLTVVAKGACIFGQSQLIPQDKVEKSLEDESGQNKVLLKLYYEPMTSSDNEMISGIVESEYDSALYIQIYSDNGYFTSDKIKMENGKFKTTIAVERYQQNNYQLHLTNKEEDTIPVYPSSFTITHGLAVDSVPIPHNVGVVYAAVNTEGTLSKVEACDVYFEKNSRLPLVNKKSFKTERKLRKNAKTPLPIKVYEGDSNNPENNEIISKLYIEGDKLPYDLPAGTDLDITISIDISRKVTISAYFPDIDLSIDARTDIYYQSDLKVLKKDLDCTVSRKKTVNEYIPEDELQRIEEKLNEVYDGIESQEEEYLKKAEKSLREIKEKLDIIEERSKIARISDGFYNTLAEARESIAKNVRDKDRKKELLQQLNTAEAEGKRAISEQNSLMLEKISGNTKKISFHALAENPQFWVDVLLHIENNHMPIPITDTDVYNRHVKLAHKAISESSLIALKENVRELIRFLPPGEYGALPVDFAGIVK